MAHKGAALGSPMAEVLLLVRQATAATGGNLRCWPPTRCCTRPWPNWTFTIATRPICCAPAIWMPTHAKLPAIRRNVAEATIYLHQQRAVDLLAATVRLLEQAAQVERQAVLEGRLPPPTYTAVDRGGVADRASGALPTTPQAPGLVMLDGIGGIGKSSLPTCDLRVLIAQDSFADIAWISAQRQLFHLDGKLRQIPRPC